MAGELVPELVAVSHDAFEVTVNGTVLPVPMVDTWNDCAATVCVPPAGPLKFSDVGETFSTGFVVTTRLTGMVVVPPWPPMLTRSAVL